MDDRERPVDTRERPIDIKNLRKEKYLIKVSVKELTMNYWEEYDIGDKVNRILADVEDDGRHFGRPFLTAYQLAIEFDSRHHDVVTRLGKEVGGAGTGKHTSIAQYLALELSRKIKDEPDYPVEGAFISNRYVRELSYNHNNKKITSSLTGTQYSLSMFRYSRRSAEALDGIFASSSVALSNGPRKKNWISFRPLMTRSKKLLTLGLTKS